MNRDVDNPGALLPPPITAAQTGSPSGRLPSAWSEALDSQAWLKLVAYAHRNLRLPVELAEDEVQEVRARMMAGGYDRQGLIRRKKLLPWIKGVLRNRALHVYRELSRFDSLATVSVSVLHRDPFAVAHAACVKRDLADALAELSREQQAALILHDLEGRGDADIAAQCGVSVETIRQRRVRARRRIRRILARYAHGAKG